MSWTNRLRRAAFRRLPQAWQPAATYHYCRARGVLEPELPVVCLQLPPGRRAIDVGANEGVYTHAFLAAGAIVESFEPQPDCLGVLHAYARRHLNVHVPARRSPVRPGARRCTFRYVRDNRCPATPRSMQ